MENLDPLDAFFKKNLENYETNSNINDWSSFKEKFDKESELDRVVKMKFNDFSAHAHKPDWESFHSLLLSSRTESLYIKLYKAAELVSMIIMIIICIVLYGDKSSVHNHLVSSNNQKLNDEELLIDNLNFTNQNTTNSTSQHNNKNVENDFQNEEIKDIENTSTKNINDKKASSTSEISIQKELDFNQKLSRFNNYEGNNKNRSKIVISANKVNDNNKSVSNSSDLNSSIDGNFYNKSNLQSELVPHIQSNEHNLKIESFMPNSNNDKIKSIISLDEIKLTNPLNNDPIKLLNSIELSNQKCLKAFSVNAAVGFSNLEQLGGVGFKYTLGSAFELTPIKILSFRIGLDVNLQNHENNTTTEHKTSNTAQSVLVEEKVISELVSVTIPIGLQFNIFSNNKWKIYTSLSTKAQLFVSKGYNGYRLAETDNTTIKSVIGDNYGSAGFFENGSIDENLNIQLGVGVGLERQLSESLTLYIEPEFNYSIFNTLNSSIYGLQIKFGFKKSF